MSSREDECAGEEEGFRLQVDEMSSRVDELELKVQEVSRFYSSRNNGANAMAKDKDKEKSAAATNKKLVDLTRKEAGCSKRMQELMRQFGTILRQLAQHKWAWPFLQPVDVKGLDLDDYFDVIKNPMDFETIRKKMEMKDGSGYKNVREIYADARLVFTNAMTYNGETSDVHKMAKTLLDKLEEKWLQLYPKVVEEETKQKAEEAQALEEMEVAEKAAMAKVAMETDNELSNIYLQLDDLRDALLSKCRKMTTEEKRKLGTGLSRLSPEDLTRALEIIAQNNPSFQAMAEEVDLDMDALSEATLWRLTFFVKKSLEGAQAKGSATKSQDNSKRKKEIIDALAKTQKRRAKKLT